MQGVEPFYPIPGCAATTRFSGFGNHPHYMANPFCRSDARPCGPVPADELRRLNSKPEERDL